MRKHAGPLLSGKETIVCVPCTGGKKTRSKEKADAVLELATILVVVTGQERESTSFRSLGHVA